MSKYSHPYYQAGFYGAYQGNPTAPYQYRRQLDRVVLGQWILGGTTSQGPLSQNISESFALSESLILGAVKSAALSESLVLSDSIASKTQTQSIALSESVKPLRSGLLGSIALDLWTLGRASYLDFQIDYVSFLKSTLRALTESNAFPFTETVVLQSGKLRLLNESLTLSDYIASTGIVQGRNLSEALIKLPGNISIDPFTLAINGYGIPVINFSGYVVEVDTLSRTKFTIRQIAESNILSESINAWRTQNRRVLESLPLSESVQRVLTLGLLIRIVADSLTSSKNMSLAIRTIANTMEIVKFASSSDYNRPNNGQPLEGNETEIFDDVPETITEENNPLGTDVVPFYE